MTPQDRPRKPFSEAPRRGSLLDQKALQVAGDVTKCDPHPEYEELFYWGKNPNGTQRWATEDYWIKQGTSTPTEIHEKQRKAREYNLTKPDSEPRVIESGISVGHLDQSNLQVEGDFVQCDPHPEYEGLFYWNTRTKGNQYWATEEHWKNMGIATPTEIHEKQRKAREYNLTKPDSEPRVYEDGSLVGCVDQQSMQVSWKPKYGDVHPKYPNFRYVSKRRGGSQMWYSLEAFNKKKEQNKVWKQTPEGRASNGASSSKYRTTKGDNIKLPDNLKKEIDEIYELRTQLNEAAAGAGMYGRGANKTKRYSFAVDHIIPVNPAPILFNGAWQRPYSCLQAPWNLQILEASENMSKSNATPEQFAY